ncbi:zinc finger protein 467-like [Scleropages formosus]|uniref:zinc finger protein 467-like n=1 Tax=Scleropages formosus TaxID=113540 RepID=UPI0010FA87DA|nr:zinc finger protein 467-like [Scleropages formosus]
MATVKRVAAAAAITKVRKVAMALSEVEEYRTPMKPGPEAQKTKERRYECSVCGKRFQSRSHIKEHHRVHTGERPFPCDRCERSFTTPHNLRRHQGIHIKEDSYRCTLCGVLFCHEHTMSSMNSPSSPSPSSPKHKYTPPSPELLSSSKKKRPSHHLPSEQGKVKKEEVEMVSFQKCAGGLRKVAYEIEVVL